MTEALFRAKQDMHVHTQLSLCSSDAGQNPAAILDWAVDRGLDTVCFTDHYWDAAIPGAIDWYRQQDRAHVDHIRDMLPGDTRGVQLLIGCETEYTGGSHVGISPPEAERMDFINLPFTHMHMVDFVRPSHIRSHRAVAALWLERFEQALALPLPWHKVAFAHISNLLGFDDQLEGILDLLPLDALRVLFDRCAELGAKVELNGSSLSMPAVKAHMDSHLRLFEIAGNCGCRFTLGSDAHHPANLTKLKAAEEVVTALGLREEHIFDPAELNR